jgi:hypothetical protein
MQRSELLRRKAMIENPENSDSESTDSNATVNANPETDPQYCQSFLFIRYAADLI